MQKAHGRQSGIEIIRLIKSKIRFSDIITVRTLENALAVCCAIGGSTNALIHLLAIAAEFGYRLKPEDVDRISRKTPTLTAIKPAGPHTLFDLDCAGGIPAVLKRLMPRLHGYDKNVFGQKLRAVADRAKVLGDEIIRSVERSVFDQDGHATLEGNLAPVGAYAKQSAVDKVMLSHIGPTRVFDNEQGSESDL